MEGWGKRGCPRSPHPTAQHEGASQSPGRPEEGSKAWRPQEPIREGRPLAGDTPAGRGCGGLHEEGRTGGGMGAPEPPYLHRAAWSLQQRTREEAPQREPRSEPAEKQQQEHRPTTEGPEKGCTPSSPATPTRHQRGVRRTECPGHAPSGSLSHGSSRRGRKNEMEPWLGLGSLKHHPAHQRFRVHSLVRVHT